MERYRPPSTRPSLTTRVEACGFKMYVTTSFREDDVARRIDPIEVFVQISKHGDVVSGVVDSLAVSMSIALQYGTPWRTLREKYVGTRFGAADSNYTSIVDAIAKAVDTNVANRKASIGWDEEPPPAGTTAPVTPPQNPPDLTERATFVHPPDEVTRGRGWWRTANGGGLVTAGQTVYHLSERLEIIRCEVDADGALRPIDPDVVFSKSVPPGAAYSSWSSVQRALEAATAAGEAKREETSAR